MESQFENLNMKNLRDVLCEIFFDSEEDKKYIVPLQGNWYNPIQKNSVDNWIGYVINTMESEVSVVQDWHDGNRYLRNCKSNIHLTFIGADAEEMAQSVLWWIAREDVRALFDNKYKGVVNNKKIEIYTSFYEQTGLNSTLCWNVDFSLQHNMLLDANSPLLKYADLSGNLIIGGNENGR